MRKLTALVFFGWVLTAATPDYFPLHVGNQWVYRSSGFAVPEIVTVEVTGVERIGGQAYYAVRGLPGGAMRLRVAESGDLIAYDATGQREVLWAAFSGNAGETFRSAVDACSTEGAIDSKSAAYRGPVGEFSTALRVRYRGNCADAGMVQETFLPYIGLLQREITTIGGPRRYDLIYARVGGVTVVSEREISFALAITGDPTTARITLRHSQPDPLRIVFNSGQTFDLRIRDERGDIVYVWSADKLFTQAIREVFFPPGETNWVVLVPLRPGKYTAEAWLTTIPPDQYRATVGFEVK